MLEYEDELTLSDAISARYRLLKDVESEGREPSASEQEIIQVGEKAIRDLVDAYLPRVYALASTVNSRTTSASEDQRTELIQVGAEAAMKVARSYNLRGKSNHGGVRFSTYSTQSITKAMYRYVASQSTPYRLDITVIQMSWRWRAAEEQLKEELKHQPTDEEIEQRSNVDRDVVQDFPSRNEFLDTDNPESPDIPSVNDQVFRIQSEEDSDAAKLIEVFTSVFNDAICKQLVSYLGIDRMMPRTVEEFAIDMGYSKVIARREAGYLQDLLSHPQWRWKLYNALQSIEAMEPASEDDS